MILKKYILRLKAMSLQMTRAELLERCDVPEYTMDAALRGEDIPAWEAAAILAAVEYWEGGDHGSN